MHALGLQKRGSLEREKNTEERLEIRVKGDTVVPSGIGMQIQGKRRYDAASVDDEGIGVKIAGFAQFSSPKKHNGAAGLDMRLCLGNLCESLRAAEYFWSAYG
ncbi:hypothetical protein ACET3Z_015929 [Daucus carota]